MIKSCMVRYIHLDVVLYGDVYSLGCKWVVQGFVLECNVEMYHALLGSISNFTIQQGMFMFLGNVCSGNSSTEGVS
jgi:hypothetical protein